LSTDSIPGCCYFFQLLKIEKWFSQKKEEEDKDNRENKDVDFYHCKSKRWIVKNNKDVFNKRKETL